MNNPHRRMEQAATDFASAWREFFLSDRTGPRPRIDTAYKAVEPELSADQRLELLEWLLTEEVRQRKNHGEQPAAADYYEQLSHLPEYRRIIYAVLSSLQSMGRGTDESGPIASEKITAHDAERSAATDHNLLFGILALQNNFVTREALLAAFGVWIVDKRRPLGELLCEQGKLTKLQDELLRALTAEHVKQHGNDPEQSLAAVSSVGSLRDDLRKLGDPQLEASLAAVSQNEPAVDPNATNVPSVGEWSGAGLRFRVLRPHAKGGLGEVFVAHDEELHREVALKEIQLQYADQPSSRSRFLLEAEITGGLEHPGIVPVYGLGQYADGRPFYAMRFIRGDSLKEAIERFHKPDVPGRDPGERTLEFRKLLGRFIDVCEAIEYAHSRGVLHRDLKPGNIMLGKYGETLVVDWGLAKPVGRGERGSESDETTLRPSSGDSVDPTIMGKVLGTPAYMSPEQAGGRLNELGPASDVYSLGATLYCLLTGQPPFSSNDVGEILRRVQSGDFLPPRAVKPYVPAALQAICLKAMALKPLDRFPSPQALADDLEHWLADEPVGAHHEGPPAQAARWVRKHRAWAMSGAAALVLGLIVALAFLQLTYRHNTQLRTERDRADEKANEARRNLYTSCMNFVQDAWENSRMGRMRELLDQWRPPPESVETSSDAPRRASETVRWLGFCGHANL